ncbi:hypothetical protein CSPX01_14076 [Colletotrichum filicis]|nr:hypothetical protein CSPX01_14076 [Colletotrichum filicis]
MSAPSLTPLRRRSPVRTGSFASTRSRTLTTLAVTTRPLPTQPTRNFGPLELEPTKTESWGPNPRATPEMLPNALAAAVVINVRHRLSRQLQRLERLKGWACGNFWPPNSADCPAGLQ